MASSAPQSTISTAEVAHFEAMADDWWSSLGKFRPLHQLNPPRLAFAREVLLAHFGRDGDEARPFAGLTLLDAGCGGGLLSEPMARLGFAVSGVDASEKAIRVAREHAAQSGLTIDYRVATPEQIEESFDVVLSMEVIEHVADTEAFAAALAARLKPGGAFLGATLNRTAKSMALAVVGAEYLLRWLPRGTHDWRKFLKPSEFAALLRRHGIAPGRFEGQSYNPLADRWDRSGDLAVNYSLSGTRLP